MANEHNVHSGKAAPHNAGGPTGLDLSSQAFRSRGSHARREEREDVGNVSNEFTQVSDEEFAALPGT